MSFEILFPFQDAGFSVMNLDDVMKPRGLEDGPQSGTMDGRKPVASGGRQSGTMDGRKPVASGDHSRGLKCPVCDGFLSYHFGRL